MERLTEYIHQKTELIETKNASIHNIQTYTKEKIQQILHSLSLQIGHIYGNHEQYLQKIKNGTDRTSYVLEIDGKDIWFFSFKNTLMKEDTAIKNVFGSIELKSFFLYDEQRKWNIWYLWKFFLEKIHETFEDFDGIYVTVSKNNAEKSLNMFKKLWFRELYSKYWEYNTWDTEVHLFFEKNQKIYSEL